jgi:hypothetical protein
MPKPRIGGRTAELPANKAEERIAWCHGASGTPMRPAALALESFARAIVNAIVRTHMPGYKSENSHLMLCGRLIMATGHALSAVLTKAAYVCLAAAAFVFVAMLLLTGLHP